MKIYFLALSLLFFGCRQLNQSKLNFSHKKTELKTTSLGDTITFTSTISKVDLTKTNTNQGSFYHLTLDNYTKTGNIGEPQLAKVSKMIKVPTSYYPELILDSSLLSYQRIPLKKHKLIPLQASESKLDSTGTTFLTDYKKTNYEENKWTAQEVITLEKVGKTKAHTLYRLTIHPFMYNPHKNILKLITEIQGTIQLTLN